MRHPRHVRYNTLKPRMDASDYGKARYAIKPKHNTHEYVCICLIVGRYTIGNDERIDLPTEEFVIHDRVVKIILSVSGGHIQHMGATAPRRDQWQ